jgi:hypothetical protein
VQDIAEFQDHVQNSYIGHFQFVQRYALHNRVWLLVDSACLTMYHLARLAFDVCTANPRQKFRSMEAALATKD